jgi:hypothetical protein
VRDTWDTGLHRYPVALMNWDLRKNSAHGEAEMTSLIPNQVIINQMASMIALWIKLHGFPKVIYDKTRIPSWDNSLSSAIAVNGTESGGVGGAAQYMQPAQISAAVQSFFEQFIRITKEAAGANEAALGESAPVNTSAIIVNSKNAAVPLNSVKRRFYRYIEDVGLIWLDFWMSKYTEYPNKSLEVTRNGIKQVVKLDTELLKKVRLKLKIDVGPSSPWNEAAQIQTLDNLLNSDKITFIEYLKRLPNGLIPDKQGLIDARGNEDEKQLLYELMARFIETLPPEQRQQLMSLPPEQLEEAVKTLIMGGEQNGQAGNELQQQGGVPQMAGVRQGQQTGQGTRPYANQNIGTSTQG